MEAEQDLLDPQVQMNLVVVLTGIFVCLLSSYADSIDCL